MNDARRKKIGDLIRQMEQDAACGAGDRPQRVSMAQIQFELAEEHAESAEKLGRYTRWLIGFTVALVALTVFLCVDAYFSHHDIGNKDNAVSRTAK